VDREAAPGVMSAVLQDIPYALRRLGKAPALTAVALVTLAPGIGMNAAIFRVLNRDFRLSRKGR